MPPTPIEIQITPRGQLCLVAKEDAPALPEPLHQALVEAFAVDAGHGLLYLGANLVGTALPPALGWWRDFAARYIVGVCTCAEGAAIAVEVPDGALLADWIADAPPMPGAEYLEVAVLVALWQAIETALKTALKPPLKAPLKADGTPFQLPLQDFLKARHPAWNLVGRVHFNLAENRKDSEAPFAFLATYTARLSATGKPQHLPLSKALAEYADAKHRNQLLSLLEPVKNAAALCPWLQDMVQQGAIYHPLRWTAQEAFLFLTDVPLLERAGVVVRVPQSWGAARPARPQVSAQVGAKPPSLLGSQALLDFQMGVTLDGEALSAAEVQALLAGVNGLQLMRGRWVEVDRDKLRRMLERFAGIEQQAQQSGLSLAQAMRLVSGAALEGDADLADLQWSQLKAGPWLQQLLQDLRQPEGLAPIQIGTELQATLRPYQQAGVQWLYLLHRLGLGACLADDMGLGKTIQVLALLLVLRREQPDGPPSVLVAPASLLANWAAEAQRFAPSLRLLLAHPSAMPGAELRALDGQKLAGFDLVITSYGTLLRQPQLLHMQWRLAVIDEAQAIKNPASKQTRQTKKLQAQTRIALTGTPVENSLGDLWSIFDFTHPALLGSATVFSRFAKKLSQSGHYGPLKTLVQPYILRRLKTDKRVIKDLPDKTEVKSWCLLSPSQAALYQTSVHELGAALENKPEGIERRGLVLAFLMRFKQICNHPSQWTGDGVWAASESGKFARLRELVEVIAARQEKVLVFTQFRETTQPLAAFLGTVFGRAGLVLHGGTPVAERRQLVQQFQEDEQTPFFVLSLKAGGAGLNLTAAAHVIHFDRWWNPAVENQATDRAFRIGQKNNVLVHKFVCRGTVEDRIDQLIESKRQLVSDVLEGGAELALTQLSDAELLDLVKLDIHAVDGG